MEPTVLTLNVGSSSVKFALYEGEDVLADGGVERIGEDQPAMRGKTADGRALPGAGAGLADHAGAIGAVLDSLAAAFPGRDLAAIGHRVVHGGTEFDAPVLVDDAVLARLDALAPFAPLHQPHNLAGVRAAMAAYPGVPQVACFDTAFHRSQPWVNDTFALPRAYYDAGVRRYGFHGISYDYIAGALRSRAPLIAAGRVVVAHLGNGASICGMLNGRSVASSMGFSALDGLPMGTRCGQIDPGVLLYLMDQGMTAPEISDMLYRRSGLIGLSGGIASDMRSLEASDAPEAAEAIAYFTAHAGQALGTMAAALGGIDALVFCGGIGENSRLIRARICEGAAWMGIEIDHSRNAANAEVISSGMSRVRVMVIPTDEGLVIARAARDILRAA
ncbi:MAG: acetate/propionate family kinase [Paracoccus sp. (in: a-proteobacteria)]|nr:acetate/propionate family kinase [Paracoccus sp. (in: a-proteobacteria)]